MWLGGATQLPKVMQPGDRHRCRTRAEKTRTERTRDEDWRERHSESGRQREGSRHILAAAGALGLWEPMGLGPWNLPAHQEGGLVVSLTVPLSLQFSSLYSSAVGAGVPGPPGPPRLCHLPWPLKPQEGQQDTSPWHPSLLNATGPPFRHGAYQALETTRPPQADCRTKARRLGTKQLNMALSPEQNSLSEMLVGGPVSRKREGKGECSWQALSS